MLNFLRIQNFKAFEDVSLQFKPLTLMAGLNGMGKSSVLQSLLLLRQSYEQRLLSEGLALNGDLVKIGTGKDALFERAASDDISFELGFKPELIVNLRWICQYDRKSDVIKTKTAPNIVEYLLFSLSAIGATRAENRFRNVGLSGASASSNWH
jgi:predicted ATPase